MDPVPKPRMTRGDKITMSKMRRGKRLNEREQARSSILGRWMEYCDLLKWYRVKLDMDKFYHVIFVMPMAKSWSKKKCDEHRNQRHQAKPDKDNLEKGLLDGLFGEDMAAWDGRVTKVWGDLPFIIIAQENMDIAAELAALPRKIR